MKSISNRIEIADDDTTVSPPWVKIVGAGPMGCAIASDLFGLEGPEVLRCMAVGDVDALERTRAHERVLMSDPDLLDRLTAFVAGSSLVCVALHDPERHAPLVATIRACLEDDTVLAVSLPAPSGAKTTPAHEQIAALSDLVFQVPDGSLEPPAAPWMSVGPRGLIELSVKPGLVGVDWRDVSKLARSAGVAAIGFGAARGKNRATLALRRALTFHPSDTRPFAGATKVLVSIAVPEDARMSELQAAIDVVEAEAHPDADIIWGAYIQPEVDKSEVRLIAAGFSTGRSV